MSIREKIAQFARYHRTVRELNALDSRLLRDIGITRAEIHDIASGRTL